MPVINWICTVEAVNESYQGDIEDLSATLLARIGKHHGRVAFGDGRITATFTIHARLALQAVEVALKTWSKALDDTSAWSVVSLSTRRADQPEGLPALPEVLGIAEMAGKLGVSSELATDLARNHQQFPPPIAELASGPVWTTWQIGAFQRAWNTERRDPEPGVAVEADPTDVAHG